MSSTTDPAPASQPRICRTTEEAFQAGWDAGDGERMPAHLIDRLAALLSPYLLPPLEGAQAPAA